MTLFLPGFQEAAEVLEAGRMVLEVMEMVVETGMARELEYPGVGVVSSPQTLVMTELIHPAMATLCSQAKEVPLWEGAGRVALYTNHLASY